MVTSSVRLTRRLGEGGMGSVWLADHQALKTNVVVKFMAAELAHDVQAIGRFTREAAAASQVKSPHVVQMLDHGVSPDGLPYIVMEHLDGHDLGAHIETHGALPGAEVVEIVSQVARALGRAHEAGIVHRDIKPSNIFLCDAGGGQLFVKLLDFGIAKGVEGNLLDSKTRTGSLLGSPHYMSPEQVIGGKVDARSDLWSLGVVAYEALTGQKPFDADTIGGLALKIHHEPLPLPSASAAHLPKSVDLWFEKACARDAAARFGSAKELADALAVAVRGELPSGVSVSTGSYGRGPEEAFAKTTLDTSGPPPTPKRKLPYVAAAAGALALGVVALAVVPRLRREEGATGAPLVASTSAIAAQSATLPPPAPATAEAAPTASVAQTALQTGPKPPKVDKAHPAASSAASVAAPPPSASARPVPSHDPYDIK